MQVSPAAISGAVRYLTQVNLARRERELGSRRDVYQVYDDVWYEAIFRKDQVIDRWRIQLKEGIDALGAETPAGKRISETQAFFDFVHGEMPAMLDRWRVYRAEQFGL